MLQGDIVPEDNNAKKQALVNLLNKSLKEPITVADLTDPVYQTAEWSFQKCYLAEAITRK